MSSSTFIPVMPVETILEIEDCDILAEDDKTETPICLNSSFISIGTQSDRKTEPQDSKSNLVSDAEDMKEKLTDLPDETSLLEKPWSPSQSNLGFPEKFMPYLHAQYSFESLSSDEKLFLESADYKTRNKLKTEQRRQDPLYRTQERVRQRTVMRIKRQDPRFRAEEREKGRYRMRLKRLDPVFRSQERERQRERMKLKRSDPGFREREREQQKSRMHVKRLDPIYKEKEENLRLRMKEQNIRIYSLIHSDKDKISSPSVKNIISENQTITHSLDFSDNSPDVRSNQAVFPENINNKLLSVKSREAAVIEAFHCQKQHFVNLNFYNSIRGEWAAHEDLYSKSNAHLRFINVNESFGPSQNVNPSKKEDLESSKKDVPKNVTHSEAPVIIKTELPLPEAQKQSTPTNDSLPLDRFSLSLCTDK